MNLQSICAQIMHRHKDSLYLYYRSELLNFTKTEQFHDRWTNDVNPQISDFDANWCKGLLRPVKLLIQILALYDQ